MKKQSYERAKISILNYIISFCTHTLFKRENGYFYNSHHGDIPHGFVSCYGDIPQIGALVRLSAAPLNTKYYLSWLKEIDEKRDRYLLESVDDGSLCWWYNVGLEYLPLETSDRFPHWKMNDKQYSFWDRWDKAHKWEDDYWSVPLIPLFEDKTVTLKLRTKFSDQIFSKTFPNWEKLTIKEMREFIKDKENYRVENLDSLLR